MVTTTTSSYHGNIYVTMVYRIYHVTHGTTSRDVGSSVRCRVHAILRPIEIETSWYLVGGVSWTSYPSTVSLSLSLSLPLCSPSISRSTTRSTPHEASLGAGLNPPDPDPVRPGGSTGVYWSLSLSLWLPLVTLWALGSNTTSLSSRIRLRFHKLYFQQPNNSFQTTSIGLHPSGKFFFVEK